MILRSSNRFNSIIFNKVQILQVWCVQKNVYDLLSTWLYMAAQLHSSMISSSSKKRNQNVLWQHFCAMKAEQHDWPQYNNNILTSTSKTARTKLITFRFFSRKKKIYKPHKIFIIFIMWYHFIFNYVWKFTHFEF